MERTSFDLEKRTEDFALRVIGLFRNLPQDEVARVIGRQLLRSGTSVGANYREATRARSKAEFAAKLGDSLKEANETAYWLTLLVRSDVFSESRLHDLRRECDELIAIFVSSIGTVKQGRA